MPETVPPTPPDDQNALVVTFRWRVTRAPLVWLAIALSLFYLRTYQRLHDPVNGWTKMIRFGGSLASQSLPRLGDVAHHTTAPDSPGSDGQFYAQMALDPSLRDPGFDQALDNPTYRARRIGMPAFSFLLGWGKPRRVLQAYALTNLLAWFVLVGVLFWLFNPTTIRRLVCLCAALLGYGIVASMELAVTDLPATALIFLGLALGSWGGYAALAGAALTRETSVLAAFSLLNPRRPWRQPGEWKRPLPLLAIALGPLTLWMAYVLWRFGRAQDAAGLRNFSLPFVAMFECFGHALGRCIDTILGINGPDWSWLDDVFGQPLMIAGLFFQLLYLLLRRDPSSPIWRTGLLYGLLCVVLGTAVWEEATNAARALLPMTVGFYLHLARERQGRWFWWFFLLGSLSVPYAVHEFWLAT